MNIRTKHLLFLTAVVAACSPRPSEIQLSALFTDGVVLQGGVDLHVWGTARSGAEIRVTLSGSEGAAAADANGDWSVHLPAMEAGGPYELMVRGVGEDFLIRDVMIGDVWVASGQSNMEWPVSASGNAEAEIAGADAPMIREFKIPHIWSAVPVDTVVGGPWRYAVPEQVGDFSAVAYYFARELRRHVGTTNLMSRQRPREVAEHIVLGVRAAEAA